MKAIVTFSGGKDSLASLLWVRNNLTKDFITVFCDTGWEHPLTYKYIEEIRDRLSNQWKWNVVFLILSSSGWIAAVLTWIL